MKAYKNGCFKKKISHLKEPHRWPWLWKWLSVMHKSFRRNPMCTNSHKQTRPSNKIKRLDRLTKPQSPNLVKNFHNAYHVVKIITRALTAFTVTRHATHVTRRATFRKYASQILTKACMKLKSKTSSFISRRDPPK